MNHSRVWNELKKPKKSRLTHITLLVVFLFLGLTSILSFLDGNVRGELTMSGKYNQYKSSIKKLENEQKFKAALDQVEEMQQLARDEKRDDIRTWCLTRKTGHKRRCIKARKIRLVLSQRLYVIVYLSGAFTEQGSPSG